MSVTVLHGNQALMAGSPWEMATVIHSARLCILRLWEKVNQTEHHAFLKPKGITWSEARCVIKKEYHNPQFHSPFITEIPERQALSIKLVEGKPALSEKRKLNHVVLKGLTKDTGTTLLEFPQVRDLGCQ